MTETTLKRRRPWIAVVMSFLSIPASYLYAGRPIRALVITSLWLALIPAIMVFVCKLPVTQAGIWALAFVLLYPILIGLDVFHITSRSAPAPLKRYQRWWIYIAVFLLSTVLIQWIAFASKSYITEAFIFPGRSMYPTLQHNDRVLVDKLWFDATKLNRNDVVSYFSLEASQLCVGRIAGLPGETLEIRDETLFINRVEVFDQHADFSAEGKSNYPEMSDYGPFTIPAESYFILGDNRRSALDSRINGPVSFKDVRSIVRLIYWSNDYAFSENFYGSTRENARCGDIRWDRIGTRLDQWNSAPE